MIPNGKTMDWHGHKLVFESENNPCRGCFFEDKGECPECDEGLWVEEPNPWHKGEPTEEGWFLIAYKSITQDSPFVYFTWHQWRDEEGDWQFDGFRPNDFWKPVKYRVIEEEAT